MQRTAVRATGVLLLGYNTLYYLSKPPTAQTEALTANNQTQYAVVLMSTKEGPVVLDVPPASVRTAIFGSAVDIWQEPLAVFDLSYFSDIARPNGDTREEPGTLRPFAHSQQLPPCRG